MKKPDFLGIARQTLAQLRRFPTADALADAVLINALVGLLRMFFGVPRYFSIANWKQKWNWFFLPVNFLLSPLLLLYHFNLSLRLRRNEQKAWRAATILAGASLLLCSNGLLICFLMRDAPREATEAELAVMTEKDRTAYQASRERLEEMWKEKPWQSPFTPRQILAFLVAITMALNVLCHAFPKSTRARFRP